MILRTNPNQWYWYRYSGQLYFCPIWSLQLKAFINSPDGLSDGLKDGVADPMLLAVKSNRCRNDSELGGVDGPACTKITLKSPVSASYNKSIHQLAWIICIYTIVHQIRTSWGIISNHSYAHHMAAEVHMVADHSKQESRTQVSMRPMKSTLHVIANLKVWMYIGNETGQFSHNGTKWKMVEKSKKAQEFLTQMVKFLCGNWVRLLKMQVSWENL